MDEVKTESVCDYKTIEQISLKVVEASPDAMIVVNTKGIVVIFNARAELVFGYDRSEVVGKSISMLIPTDKSEQHDKHLIAYFNDPKIREMGTGQKLEGKRSDGTLFGVQIKLAYIVVPNSGVHALAVVRRVVV